MDTEERVCRAYREFLKVVFHGRPRQKRRQPALKSKDYVKVKDGWIWNEYIKFLVGEKMDAPTD
jgi:hypothetical protein